MSDANPVPASKEDLLHRMRERRLAWDNLISTVPEETATGPNLPDGSSVKDLIAHIAAYERWTAAQIRAANEGRSPTEMELYGREDLPAEAHGWNTDQINAAIREQHKDLSLAEAREFAGAAFNDLIGAIEAMPEEELLRPGAHDWVREGTLLAVIPGQSYAHYAMHEDDLRAVAGRMA